ncbi:MAG: alpha/beta fold hydrolase [Catenulispora sp.]
MTAHTAIVMRSGDVLRRARGVGMEADGEVTTHYEATGEGDPVVVIGGDDRPARFDLLRDWFRLVTPDRRDLDAPAAADFITALGFGPVRVLGWGGGAQTALNLALRRPDLVAQVAVVGPLPACGDLPCRTRLAELAALPMPLLVLQGDADALDVAHAAALARMAPGGRLAVVPGPSRALVAVKPELVDLLLLDFFQSV